MWIKAVNHTAPCPLAQLTKPISATLFAFSVFFLSGQSRPGLCLRRFLAADPKSPRLGKPIAPRPGDRGLPPRPRVADPAEEGSGPRGRRRALLGVDLEAKPECGNGRGDLIVGAFPLDLERAKTEWLKVTL